MADAFADLWKSTAPSKPSAPPQTLGTAARPIRQPTGTAAQRPKHDVFSMLASTPSTSQPNSRPITPSLAQLSGQGQAIRQQQSGSGSSGGDAFSDLLGGSLSAGKAGSKMSIADRQAAVEKERRERDAGVRVMDKVQQTQVWDGLDMFASTGTAQTKSPPQAQANDEEWIFDALTSSSKTSGTSTTTTSKATGRDDDDWGLSDFASPSTSAASPPNGSQSSSNKASSTSLFDALDDIALPPPPPPSTTRSTKPEPKPKSRSQSGTNTPGEFDFGDREDRLLGDDSSGDEDVDFDGGGAGVEEDILGVLAKPPQRRASPLTNHSRTPPPLLPPSSTTTTTNKHNNRSNRPTSPPPHIIGQIVEMGFAPQQARVALAATASGVDVQGAVEILMASANDGDGGDGRGGWGGGEERESGRLRDALFDQDAPPVHSSSKRRRPAATAAAPSMPTRQLGTGSPSSSSSRHDHTSNNTTTSNSASTSTTAGGGSGGGGGGGSGGTAADLQDRADKLLAQASELGMSVFSRANAFWREGREKVVKVYEERAAVGVPSSSSSGALAAKRRGTPTEGGGGKIRPKWMMETSGTLGEDDGDVGAGGVVGGFQDDHDEDDNHAHGGSGGGSAFLAAPVAQRNMNRPPPEPGRPTSASLFADDPSTYVSPSRRRKTPTPTPTPPLSTPSAPAPRTKSSSSSFRSPSPAPPPKLRVRPTISAPPHVIVASNKHKLAGNEMFKLGRYAEADALYTQAMAVLPAGHLLLVPLYNNRAATRLKTGDHAGSANDCSAVLALVGVDSGYHPARERKVERAEDGGGVDLGEAVVKAYKRRAEAMEGRERWDEARRDWEALAGVEWAAARMRGDAVRNAGRCRKMVRASAEANNSESMTPKSRPPPRRRPLATSTSSSSSTPAQTYDAVLKLRSLNKAQEEEDLARHELKDVVDAKLTAWKGGKENNLRALIASLDLVLWPALKWQTVGMAELVTNGQVKVRYTRAIAKLHPDKLNSSNTTLEQRMIANGVFSALNDAWNVFKQ
ncbi:hypothetical protein BD410DRAFT_831650 [Rickenella mellea]|uniref:UBA domain-containing protein n=1 Tax=Rickenella mellea TaxID=50990 RepID=A0A4Y7PNW5_9AGAM|nr:hypothetical protein BD410DRAFT_831650 [Rickenella mellea]